VIGAPLFKSAPFAQPLGGPRPERTTTKVHWNNGSHPAPSQLAMDNPASSSFAANCRAAHSCYAEHVTPKFDGDRNFPIEPEGVADKVGS
jgi:hypothetical protein